MHSLRIICPNGHLGFAPLRVESFKLGVAAEPVLVAKSDLKDHQKLNQSLMPPGLLMTLTQDEVLDLLAYLQNGGNDQAPAFAK